MNMVKTALGVFLCILGALLVLFEVGMAKSQPHAFAWLPFLSLVALGVVILAGGILLLKGYGEGTSINMGKAVMGIVLCLVGVVFVLFASAEAIQRVALVPERRLGSVLGICGVRRAHFLGRGSALARKKVSQAIYGEAKGRRHRAE